MSFDLSVLPHKNIILAVTGGIAAYKSAILVRRLKDAGFSVRVVMTKGAQAFITPLTFSSTVGQSSTYQIIRYRSRSRHGAY